MTTVAGTGVAGYNGDRELATSARFNQTYGIAVDASGNIYVVDVYYHVIRMITKSTGIITTIAGTGTSGYSGDGGPARLATLYYPGGIALDASGNIYVADTGNNVIRKITKSTGIISTVAGTGRHDMYGNGYYTGDGGLATNGTFNAPLGITLDTSGNIYVTDFGNCVIRKITNSTGIISTVAGKVHAATDTPVYYTGDGGLATSANFNGLQGIALGTSGNIYVADANNHVIRKITKSTGIVSTVAGTGTSGYSGDGGLATLATISYPLGIAFDASGNLFVADSSSSVIRKITKSTGIITTVAGTGVHGSLVTGGPTSSNLDFPAFIAIFNQTAYFTDSDSHQVRSFSAPSTSTQSPVSSSAIPNYMSVGLYNPVWWISASLLLLMW